MESSSITTERLSVRESIFSALLLISFTPLHAAGVRAGTWTETWPNKDGQLETISVTAEVWTQAFQADLDAEGQLHIPAREMPYYLDAPLVMKSGQKLTADAKAEIRLKPGSNTCMVRNENVASLNTKPVSADQPVDTDITIEGGIWTTLANGVKDNHGNQRGYSSKLKPVPGTHGVILLHNVRKVSVRNVTVRQSRPTPAPLALHEFQNQPTPGPAKTASVSGGGLVRPRHRGFVRLSGRSAAAARAGAVGA